MAENLTPVDFKQVILTILNSWEKLGLPAIDREKLNFQALPFRKSGQHSLLNFMVTSAEQPVAIIRGPRFREGYLAAAGLENEAAVLSELSQRAELAGNIPKLFGLFKVTEVPIVVEAACPGTMLHGLLDQAEEPERLEALLRSGSDLLLKLHENTRGQQRTIDHLFLADRLHAQLAAISQTFSEAAPAIKERTAAFLARTKADDLRYPEVCLHHEYNPWNLLLRPDSQLTILDWEDARLNDLPWLDFYNYFLIAFRILIVGESETSRQRGRAAQQARFDLLLRVYSEAMTAYQQALQLDDQLRDICFLLFAVDAIDFFLNEKRQDKEYARHWLRLLTELTPIDPFVSHLKLEAEIHWRSNR